MKSVPRSLVSLFSDQHRHIKPASASRLLVFVLAMCAGQVFGQTTAAVQDVTCIGNRSNNLTCTAGEFSTIVAFQAVGPTPPVCSAGSTITYNATVGLSNSNTGRYDIGFFVGQQGNDPRAATAGNICSASVVPTSILPFAPWANLDTDTCADLPGSAVTSWTVNNQKVQCVGDASGQLSIPYVVSYDQNAGVTATCSASNVVNGSPSKCNAGNAILNVGVNPVLVTGYIDLTKQTLPDGDTTPFFFEVASPSPGAQIYTSYDGGLTITPLAGNGLALLQDGQTVRIYMTVLPSPADRTLTITELLNNNWQSTVGIECTNVRGAPGITRDFTNRRISANLNQTNSAAACTITNSKNPTIAIAKVSNGGVGTFSFSSAGVGTQPTFPSITTVTPGVAVTGAAQFVPPNQVIALTEALPSGGFNVTAINCTGLGAGGTQTVNTANRTVALSAQAVSAGAAIVCTYTNSLPSSDFSITKTNGVSSLISGASTIYTIRATNSGPDAATGAILSDPAVTGLNKTAVACSAAVGNKCVTAPSVAQLEGGTFALPALAAGEFYEITVTATVTATGY
jgi:hypothetical protein